MIPYNYLTGIDAEILLFIYFPVRGTEKPDVQLSSIEHVWPNYPCFGCNDCKCWDIDGRKHIRLV